jgi:hypothetical protein
MTGEPKQSPIGFELDLWRVLYRRLEGAVHVHDSQPTCLLGDKHTVLIEENDRPRRFDVLGNELDAIVREGTVLGVLRQR